MSELRFCKDCANFIVNGEKCGRSYVSPDYVHGSTPRNSSAQIEREDLRQAACGPNARFFTLIPVSDDVLEQRLRELMKYAEKRLT